MYSMGVFIHSPRHLTINMPIIQSYYYVHKVYQSINVVVLRGSIFSSSLCLSGKMSNIHWVSTGRNQSEFLFWFRVTHCYSLLQVLMERFNADSRIFCFILSTRSGGLGVNLTGADTVIFYDSDWNPTMDAQAQDRCHRIGQTRDVHIYRLISERTVEENILKKANQKRMLGNIAIEGGNFTTAYFKEVS